MIDDITVILPTLNEAGSIGPVVTELRRHGIAAIIVADGGSTDDTAGAATRAGARVIAAGRGYGRACLAGAVAATTPYLLFMDGDGADDPAFILRLLNPVRDGSRDFAIASRWRGVRAPGSMSWHQILAGLGIGFAVRVLYGFRYTDMCAFRVIAPDTLMALGMREMGYGWNLEMQLRAVRSGLRIVEVPVDYRCRIDGESNVSGSLRGSVRAGRQILATFVRFARDRSDITAKS